MRDISAAHHEKFGDTENVMETAMQAPPPPKPALALPSGLRPRPCPRPRLRPRPRPRPHPRPRPRHPVSNPPRHTPPDRNQAFSGKLKAADAQKGALATWGHRKRLLTRVVLWWRGAARHAKLTREINETGRQQEQLKERRALEKCLTTGSRRAFFGWKALREHGRLERRAQQQQAQKQAQEAESRAELDEVEGELARLKARSSSTMLEHEQAREELDGLRAKATTAMAQKEARAAPPIPILPPSPTLTPTPTPTLAPTPILAPTPVLALNPNPANPAPDPDLNPSQAIALRIVFAKERAFLGSCLRSWRQLCTQRPGWQLEKAALEQALRTAQTSKDAEVRRVEKLQWEAKVEAQARINELEHALRRGELEGRDGTRHAELHAEERRCAHCVACVACVAHCVAHHV